MSKIQKENVNYKYGLYHNFKAIKDYHINNEISDDYINPSQCILLTFIVEEFHKNTKMPKMDIDDERYVLMNTNYILDNLTYLKISGRTLKRYLEPLKKNGLIKIYVKEKTDRYVYVNKELIDLWYDYDWTITATSYLGKMKPKLWEQFQNEWEQHFKPRSDFKLFIDNFNDNRVIKSLPHNSQNIYDHLINSVKNKLYGHGKY